MDIRRRAWLGLSAQVAFVVSWLVAAAWQVPAYSPVRHSISDMYAVGAPYGLFLVVVLTLCGAATILFALLAVRPALRSGGRSATVGAVLLALSIFGVGDLLSVAEREACQRADPSCTAADQVANVGGTLDGVLSLAGLALLVAAGFTLAAAMRRASGWSSWATPTRWASALLIVLILGAGLVGPVGGLMERLLAAAGAAAIGALAVGVARHRALSPVADPADRPETAAGDPAASAG